MTEDAMRMIKEIERKGILNIDLWNLDGRSIEEVTKILCSLEEDILEAYPVAQDIKLNIEYTGYDGGVGLFLSFIRPETPAEEKVRLKTEERENRRVANLEAKREEKERKEFERLKKKYNE
jgi:hypothetical protein